MKLRATLAIAAAIAACAGCGPKGPATPPGPPPVPLHLAPACDLAPSAGLSWIVEAKPRAIAETADLIPYINLVVPDARFAKFAAYNGGIDLRQVQDLCYARYTNASLTVARTPLDPARVERAFGERVTRTDQVRRAVDVPNPPVVRLAGDVAGATETLVIFGREAVALEEGAAGPVRAAELFAQGKLKRAVPALRSEAVARAGQLLGAQPIRGFARGPFEGESAKGLGGLLAATTAVGISARFAGPPARIAIRVVLVGAWGKDGPAAAERLAAAADIMSESPLGRLLGVNRPVEGPKVDALEDALVLDAVVDGAALAKGLHDALDADFTELFRR